MLRFLAVRRLPPVPRRHLHGRPSVHTAEITKLSEAERVEATKQLDKMDEELQSKLVQEIDAYLQWSTHSTANGMFNQVLTFCGVPKGKPRKTLIWCSGLVSCLIAAWELGHWNASTCMQYCEDQRKNADEAKQAT